jgi:hypothetical protein
VNPVPGFIASQNANDPPGSRTGAAAGLKAKARNFASAAGRPIQPVEWRKGRKEIGLEAMPGLEKWKNDGLNGNLDPPHLIAN